MDIDLDALTEEELIALNHKIVERLRTLQQLKTQKKMFDFTIGQQVSFVSPAGKKITGVLTRYNKKTVTVITQEGQRWNVSPGFLRAAEKPKASNAKAKGGWKPKR
jgi:hypothetical protein